MAEIKEIKYTQKQMFEAVIGMAKGEVVAIPKDKIVEFAEKKIEQLEKKSSSGSARKSEEHEAFMDIIRDVLVECADARGMQCGAIVKDSRIAAFKWADGKETSSQRVSSILKKMCDSGDVVKVTDKKVSYFHLA